MTKGKPKRTRDAVESQRNEIARKLNEGLTVSQVARLLACSRTTVHKVKRILQNDGILTDGRVANLGRPVTYTEEIWNVVRALRKKHDGMGERMLHHYLRRRAEDYGIDANDVPSPSSIGTFLRAEGLAYKPIGPKDKRVYPDSRPTTPGTVTIDLWGPWYIRASRMYCINIQDRFTRASLTFPIFALTHSAAVKATINSWAKAIVMSTLLMPPGQLPRHVYADNGIGMAPTFGRLPKGAKAALNLGSTLTFIPPGQPWRNGRLERFNGTMEAEYFRREKPSTTAKALEGLRLWLNFFNCDRPHSALGYKAPADVFNWLQPFETPPWDDIELDDLDSTTGTIEAIRVVHNNGVVELWQRDYLRISEVFAGQFVRVQFHVTGEPSHGRVIYNRKRGEDIVIATFNHRLDDPTRRQTEPLVTEVLNIDFDAGTVPQNQRLDEEQLEKQVSRRLKRRRKRAEPNEQT